MSGRWERLVTILARMVVATLLLSVGPVAAHADIGDAAATPKPAVSSHSTAPRHGVIVWGTPTTLRFNGAAADQQRGAVFGRSTAGLLGVATGGATTFWRADGASIAGAKLPFGGAPLVVVAGRGFVVIENVPVRPDRAVSLPVSADGSRVGAPIALPDLPRPLRDMSATVMGSRLFVAGNAGSVFAIDLPSAGGGARTGQWRALPPITGCVRLFLVTQYDGRGDRLHALCSRAAGAGVHLGVWRWSGESDTGRWRESAASPIIAAGMGAPAAVLAQGQSNILAFATPNADPSKAASLLIYNAVIERWRATPGIAPNIPPSALVSDGSTIFAVRAVNSGVVLSQFGFQSGSRKFGILDMSVIALYLAGMVLVGLWFKSRTKSTDDFFRGGQSIPWWAAALSIHAALLSSLTYLGLPALVYRTNWVMFLGMIILIPITPVIVYWIMPFFRRIDATSAYEYLSRRFDMRIRLLASALFAVFHIGRIAIVLSLSGLALASVTPLAPWQSVLLMGVLSMAYSSMGGVEAVVWTEALQTLVLSLGAVLCIAFRLHGIGGGFGHYVSQGLADGKFTVIDWNFGYGSWLTFSIWVVILGGLGQNLSTYGADQAVIQRYLVTSTEKRRPMRSGSMPSPPRRPVSSSC